jgi:hypothetical protein
MDGVVKNAFKAGSVRVGDKMLKFYKNLEFYLVIKSLAFYNKNNYFHQWRN